MRKSRSCKEGMGVTDKGTKEYITYNTSHTIKEMQSEMKYFCFLIWWDL